MEKPFDSRLYTTLTLDLLTLLLDNHSLDTGAETKLAQWTKFSGTTQPTEFSFTSSVPSHFSSSGLVANPAAGILTFPTAERA